MAANRRRHRIRTQDQRCRLSCSGWELPRPGGSRCHRRSTRRPRVSGQGADAHRSHRRRLVRARSRHLPRSRCRPRKRRVRSPGGQAWPRVWWRRTRTTPRERPGPPLAVGRGLSVARRLLDAASAMLQARRGPDGGSAGDLGRERRPTGRGRLGIRTRTSPRPPRWPASRRANTSRVAISCWPTIRRRSAQALGSSCRASTSPAPQRRLPVAWQPAPPRPDPFSVRRRRCAPGPAFSPRWSATSSPRPFCSSEGPRVPTRTPLVVLTHEAPGRRTG